MLPYPGTTVSVFVAHSPGNSGQDVGLDQLDEWFDPGEPTMTGVRPIHNFAMPFMKVLKSLFNTHGITFWNKGYKSVKVGGERFSHWVILYWIQIRVIMEIHEAWSNTHQWAQTSLSSDLQREVHAFWETLP
jgi:hypothetical protein